MPGVFSARQCCILYATFSWLLIWPGAVNFDFIAHIGGNIKHFHYYLPTFVVETALTGSSLFFA